MWEQARLALDQSWARLVGQFAALLPGFIAMIVAIAVSIALAWLLAIGLHALLNAMHFDQRLETGWPSVSDWSPHHSPALLITRLIASRIGRGVPAGA